MTLIEIWQKGTRPFDEFNNNDVLVKLARGFRHPKPLSMTKHVYTNVVLPCLSKDPASRLPFDSLVGILASIAVPSDSGDATQPFAANKKRPV